MCPYISCQNCYGLCLLTNLCCLDFLNMLTQPSDPPKLYYFGGSQWVYVDLTSTLCEDPHAPIDIFMSASNIAPDFIRYSWSFHKCHLNSSCFFRYMQRRHLIDVTEIFNMLSWEKKQRIFKLAHIIILLVISLFW